MKRRAAALCVRGRMPRSPLFPHAAHMNGFESPERPQKPQRVFPSMKRKAFHLLSSRLPGWGTFLPIKWQQ